MAGVIPPRALVIGQTGAGKSEFCTTLVTALGYTTTDASPAFPVSDDITAHTQDPKVVTAGGISVIDTPGLMDTEGRVKDVKNMATIVSTAKAAPTLHAVLLVLNEKNDRFDSAMQDCVKLFVDSLGPAILGNMGIVFTRADGERTPEQAKTRATEIAAVVQRITGVRIPTGTFPCWQVDAKIDSRPGSTVEYKAERKELVARAVAGIIAWARTQSPIPTGDFKVGEYESAKREREAQEAAQREAAARAVAESARVAAEAARADAERRAREAEAAAAHRRNNETFLNNHGFKIGGRRIW